MTSRMILVESSRTAESVIAVCDCSRVDFVHGSHWLGIPVEDVQWAVKMMNRMVDAPSQQ